MRLRGFRALGLALVLIGAGPILAGCTSPGQDPQTVAAAYLADWSAGNYTAMAQLVSGPPANFVAFHQQVARELGLQKASYHGGTLDQTTGSEATVAVTGTLTLSGLGPWKVDSTLRLVRGSGGDWLVRWTPATIDPSLGPGDSFAVTLTWPDRAPITGAGGVPLTQVSQIVTVGIVGNRIKDAHGLGTALEQAGATASEFSSALIAAQAHPSEFVPVFSLPDAVYEPIKATIYPIPGTQFQMTPARTALTPDLEAHIVGSVGSVTADELAKLGPPYAAGDIVGQSGLEGTYQSQLAGTPGGTVTVVDPSGKTLSTAATFQPGDGVALQTSIDPRIQTAAEAALDAVADPAALVAVRVSTGEVLASVSRPTNEAFDQSLGGQFPPGSTFKIVTAADLFEHNLTPFSPTTCPATITVKGAIYQNAEGKATPSLDVAQAFAQSCNTAFIGLADILPDSSFPTTASEFGLGVSPDMGFPAYGGSIPAPTDDNARAATAIGQASLLVSPLDMAEVAATVASGAYRAPRLVVGASDDNKAPEPLESGIAPSLQAMMLGVVTAANGTATGAGLPEGTYGKTGSAEYGTASPPATDAWFVGYNGDVAFAVLVVGGGLGGAVAAPIAASFLKSLGAPAGTAPAPGQVVPTTTTTAPGLTSTVPTTTTTTTTTTAPRPTASTTTTGSTTTTTG